MTTRRDPDTGKMVLHSGVWAKVGILAAGIAAGQFVPMLTGTAVTESQVAELKQDLSEFKVEMRGEFRLLRQEIREQIETHDEKTAHEGALQMLIQNGQQITEVKGRVSALERQSQD